MEIVTHGSGEILYYILNAIAAITTGSDFADLIVISTCFALVWLGFKGAFSGSAMRDNVMWMFAFLFLYQGMLLPKTTILITDKLDPTYNKTVDNVPYGLAVVGGYTSAIGNGMAELYDKAFALPNDQSYSDAGFLFGSKTVRDAASLKIQDNEFSANMSEFVKQCILYDIQSAEKYTFNQLVEADDLWDFLTVQNSQSNVWMFTYEDDGKAQIVTCNEGSQLLEAKWNTEIEERMVYLYEKNFGKADSNASAIAFMSSYIQNSNEFFMDMSKDAYESLRQNLMINAIETSTDVNSQYADLIAEMETQNIYKRTASLAQKSVITLRGVIEAVLYGVFPFIFLLFILPGGLKVFFGYTKAFIWIQLWPVMYAILHLVMSLENREALEFVHGVWTFNNWEVIQETTEDIAIMAGYMMMSIPVLSWTLVNGMQSMGYAATGLLATAAQASASAASEETRGNYSVGNSTANMHSMNSISGNKMDTMASIRDQGSVVQNSDGSETITHGNGHKSLNMDPAMSKLTTDVKTDVNLSNALETRAGQSKSAGDNINKEAMSSLSSSFETASRMAHHFNQAKENGESWTEGVDANTQESFNNITNMSNKFGAHTGASTSAEGSFGGKIPFTSIEGKVTAGVNAGISKEWSKEEQDQLYKSLETINKSSQSGSFNLTDSEGNSLNEELNSSFSEFKQLSDKKEAYYSEAEHLSQEASKHKSIGGSASNNEANGLMNYLINDKQYPMEEIRNIFLDPDRMKTREYLVSEYLEDRVNDIYSAEYGKDLMDSHGANDNNFNIQGNQTIKSSYEQKAQNIEKDSSVMSEAKQAEIKGLRNSGEGSVKDAYKSATDKNGININNSGLQKDVQSAIESNQSRHDQEESSMTITAKTKDVLKSGYDMSEPIREATTPEAPKFNLDNPTFLESQGLVKKKDEGGEDV